VNGGGTPSTPQAAHTVLGLRRAALLRSLRYQGERGFALMKQRWRAIQHVSVSPTTIGDIAKAVLVLV
jgi:hypothetical protein